MRLYIVVISFLALSSPCQADEKKIADYISYGTVITQITFNTIHNWKEADRRTAIKKELIQNGIAIGSSELIKLLVHKDRPDHSDNKSFWSEHTMIASVNQGWNIQIGVNLSLGTAAGRVIAKKHDIIDVGTAFVLGTLVERYVK